HAITALHQGENAIGATLQAQVQVRTEPARARQRIDEFAAYLGGLQAAQADAEVPWQRIEAFDQVPEPAPCFFRLAAAQVDAVVAQGDAGKKVSGAAACHKLRNFSRDLLDRPATQHRPDLGNDAEAAVEQAAVLHLDEGTLVVVEAGNASG